jgi:hypothetical protein
VERREREPELMDFGELGVRIGKVPSWWRRRLWRDPEGYGVDSGGNLVIFPPLDLYKL